MGFPAIKGFTDHALVRFIREVVGHLAGLGFTADITSVFLIYQVVSDPRKTDLMAVFAYGAFGYPDLPGDGGIPVPGLPERDDPVLLFSCQGNHPIQRFLTFPCPKWG